MGRRSMSRPRRFKRGGPKNRTSARKPSAQDVINRARQRRNKLNDSYSRLRQP